MDRFGKVVRWLGVAAIPAVAFLALSAIRSPLSLGEIANAPLEPILLTVGRWLGLAVSLWLMASHLIYTVAVLTRTDWLAAKLRPLTLPLARKVAAGLASVSMTMSSLAAPAIAQSTTTTTVEVEIDLVTAGLRQEATPTPILQPLTESRPTATAVLAPEGSYIRPLTWLVRPGDHLWSISGEHLAIVLDRAPTPEEHARYWVHVIDGARPVIRSGDPDLIYPGEEIPLPPTLDAGIKP
jgi:hypothetical protein